MVVELFDLNLPRNFVGRAVLNLDGQISTVIEAAELRRRDGALVDGTSFGSNRLWLLDRLVERGNLATTALALLENRSSSIAGSDGSLSGSEGGGVCNNALFCWQVALREVTEDGVLRPGEQFVVRDLE